MSRRRAVLLALVALLAVSGFTGCLGAEDDRSTLRSPIGGGQEGEQGETSSRGPAHGFTDTHVFEGNYSTEGPYSRVLESGPHEPRPLEFVELTSEQDGSTIEIGLVRPDLPENETSPVILDASIYLHEASLDDEQTRRQAYNDYVFTRFLRDNFVPHGYTIALLAARGTAGSGGCNDALGLANRADLDQAIDWLAERPWSNGRVGTFGFSSPAALSWNAAATGNPALETVVTVNGWPDAFTRFQRNGTWSATGVLNPPAKPAGGALLTPLPNSPGGVPDYLAKFACGEETARGAQAGAWKLAAGSDDDPAGYWDAHDVRGDVLQGFEGSAFLVHGLRDSVVPPHNAAPWAHRLAEEGHPVKQLYGQWGHDPPDQTDQVPFTSSARWDFAEVLLHWYDHWLKPRVERDLGPKVQAQDTQGRWHSHDSWPPTTSKEAQLHLQPGERLASNSTEDTGFTLLGPAPRQLVAAPENYPAGSGCAGCAVFETEALGETLRFAGSPRLDLSLTPTASVGSVSAHLYVVDEQAGYLTGGQLSLRNTEAEGPRGAPVPGRTIEVALDLEPVDAVVPEGSRLALVLAQGSWDHDSAGPGPQGVPEPGPVLVELGNAQSTLTMETFSPEDEAFFQPP